MLTPEQKQALMNAKALIQEIESMEGGTQEGEEPVKGEAEMAFNPDEKMGDQPEGEPMTDPKDVKKIPEVKESFTKKTYKDISQLAKPDASTARDKAEDKVEDIPDQDEENIGEVAKALAVIAQSLQKRNVAKSQAPMNASELVTVINDLTKVVKSMVAKQEAHEAVLEDVLEGLGVAKAIEEKQIERTVTKDTRKPVATTDTNDVLIQVTKALQSIANKGEQTYTVGNNSSDVRKSLAENLEALLKYQQ